MSWTRRGGNELPPHVARERVVAKRQKTLAAKVAAKAEKQAKRELAKKREKVVTAAKTAEVTRRKVERRREELFVIETAPRRCEECHWVKASEEFADYKQKVCANCQRYGPPPPRDPTAKLTPRELRAMEVLVAGGSIREAARISGVDFSDLSKMVRGKVMTHFRAALQAIMQNAGITMERLTKVMAETLDAETPKWNKLTDEWDMFPDHSNRRGAAKDLLHMLGASEPKEQSVKGGVPSGVQITVLTNIGSSGGSQDVPGTLVARAGEPLAIEAEYEEEPQ